MFDGDSVNVMHKIKNQIWFSWSDAFANSVN